jgi:short-subunit dehydrogenase
VKPFSTRRRGSERAQQAAHGTAGRIQAHRRQEHYSIRHELRDTGITITALMPGPTDTEFFERAGLEDTKLGSSDKDDPADVARQGFEALMAGRGKVVAGSLKNKVQASASKVMPQATGAKMHGSMTEPGSGRG